MRLRVHALETRPHLLEGPGTPTQVAMTASMDNTNGLQGTAKHPLGASSCFFPQIPILQNGISGMPLC